MKSVGPILAVAWPIDGQGRPGRKAGRVRYQAHQLPGFLSAQAQYGSDDGRAGDEADKLESHGPGESDEALPQGKQDESETTKARQGAEDTGVNAMSKTQLVVLWVGIGVVVLMGLFPPGTRGGYGFILETANVSIGRLVIEWVMVVAITGGLIYSLKVDPELMLKIACLLWSWFAVGPPRPYSDRLKDARKDSHKVVVFWVVVLALLLVGLIAIRLSMPTVMPRRLPAR